MAYEVFGNNRSIVLPIPASALTNAEYKNAYGIDLSSLDFYNLVQVQDGKEIFPVLLNDKENKVLYTADRAFSYDGGFEEISDSLIAKVIESGTIDNAKPLYCHPILIVQAGVLYASCMILNNSPTEINSWDRFKTEVISWDVETARIPAAGTFILNGEVIPSTIISKVAGNIFNIYGLDSNGSVKYIDITTMNGQVYDGVNKIN